VIRRVPRRRPRRALVEPQRHVQEDEPQQARIALDAKTVEGAAILRRLIAASDVVLNNYSPGAQSLGLDPASVRIDNPLGITICMSGYGAAGPLAANLPTGRCCRRTAVSMRRPATSTVRPPAPASPTPTPSVGSRCVRDPLRPVGTRSRENRCTSTCRNSKRCWPSPVRCC
jgi:hypothetical protein